MLANGHVAGVDTFTLIVLVLDEPINQFTFPALMSLIDRKRKLIDLWVILACLTVQQVFQLGSLA